MTSRRTSVALLCGALALAACGGDDSDSSTPSDDLESSSDSESGSDPETDDSSGDDSGDGDGGDTGAAEPAPDEPATGGLADVPALSVRASIPVNGLAGGAAIALSPDGSRLAFATGGLDPQLELYDTSSGDLLQTVPYHGQGAGLHWTPNDTLVSYIPSRLYVTDAATLVTADPVDIVPGPDAADCPEFPFDVRYDRSANAMFVADFHDTGSIVCRIDVAAASASATVIPEAALPRLFVRPGAGELVVAFNVENQLGADMTAFLDGATLAVTSTIEAPDGGVLAATATDVVTQLDPVTHQFAASGTVLAARATGERLGPYLVGWDEDALVLIDSTTGAALYRGLQKFRPVTSTDDGSVIAVLGTDTIDIAVVG